MTWAKLDDAILDNPKIAKAGVFGFALHVAAITWSCRNLTDGILPMSRVTSLLDLSCVSFDEANPFALVGGPKSMSGGDGLKAIDVAWHLVKCGLWEYSEEDHGFRLHDFLEYNPSREQVLGKRKNEAERQNKSRNKPPVTPGVTPAVRRDVTRDIESPSRVTLRHPDPDPDPLREKDLPSGDPKTPSGGQPKKSATKGHRIPSDWSPSEATIRWARGERVADPMEILPSFSDHFASAPGEKGLKIDWDATYRNWIRRELRDGKLALAPTPEPPEPTYGPPSPPTPEQLAMMAEALAPRPDPIAAFMAATPETFARKAAQ